MLKSHIKIKGLYFRTTLPGTESEIFSEIFKIYIQNVG